MKKTVPFELFGANQYLKFDIMRIAELERVCGKSIQTIIAEQQIGVDFALKALPIAMKDAYFNKPADFFAEKIESFFDDGGSLEQICVPIIQALLISGVLGSEVRDRVMSQINGDEEKNAEGTNSPSRHSKAGATGRKQ